MSGVGCFVLKAFCAAGIARSSWICISVNERGLFIVPVIGVPLLIVAPVIVNTDIVQSARWRRQFELSIDRLIRTSASDRDTSGADSFA